MDTKAEACSVEGCKRPYRAKGYCVTHFKKWRRGELPKKAHYKICGEADCHKPTLKFGMCQTHFDAWTAARKGEVAAAAPAAAPTEIPSPLKSSPPL